MEMGAERCDDVVLHVVGFALLLLLRCCESFLFIVLLLQTLVIMTLQHVVRFVHHNQLLLTRSERGGDDTAQIDRPNAFKVDLVDFSWVLLLVLLFVVGLIEIVVVMQCLLGWLIWFCIDIK